jgi:pimeloyl-ACP methyl ester carboxylesterase
VSALLATPCWFGPAARPRFGWFHAPASGHARAGVVLCPPLARDLLQAHYALRRVAEGLVQQGIVAFRFDYDGTGDSFGRSDDPSRVEAWLDSVSDALALVRASGVDHVGAVGMRVGATLAAEAARRDGGVSELVLWDPCVSGKAFLTEQKALTSLTLGVAPTRADGSVETPGMVYQRSTVAALHALSITQPGPPLAARTLVLTRPDRPPSRALIERLADSAAEFDEAPDQEQLMDVGSPFQVLPDRSIERIVTWIAQAAPAATRRVVAPKRGGAIVADTTSDGRPVIEQPVELGPLGLFGIATEAPGSLKGPTVLMLSVANEHHVGPNRMWVELARRWAENMRVVRFDLSGLGDSPTRPGQPEFVSRALEAFDDIDDVARAVSPDDPTDVVLVGLCSAAYQAVESALISAPRAIVAVNPVLSFRPPEMDDGASVDPRRRICLPRTDLIEQFHDRGRLSPLRRRFPNLGWTIRNVMAGSRRPAVWLRDLQGTGVRALFVCGDAEKRQMRSGMTSRNWHSLTASDQLRVEHIPGLDHGLLLAAHRERVTAMMTEFLTPQPADIALAPRRQAS